MRRTCRFSCGAASAVATKLTLAQYGHENVVIYNAFLEEEHPDNRRFAADCERWFEHPITVVRDKRYGASVHRVWRERGYIVNGMAGAVCSYYLKRKLLSDLEKPGDVLVYGFTVEEEDRASRMPCNSEFPLIQRGLTKSDCLAIVERAGIALPEMYRLGFNNANCIGCCKGGQGYWNHVRRTFPEVFAQAAAIQEEIGPGSYWFRNRKTGERYGLVQLDPNSGRHDVSVPECSFVCQAAEGEISE